MIPPLAVTTPSIDPACLPRARRVVLCDGVPVGAGTAVHRERLPSRVGCSVMSATQICAGDPAGKTRATRSSCTGGPGVFKYSDFLVNAVHRRCCRKGIEFREPARKAIGIGRNDAPVLDAAAVGICVIGLEGPAVAGVVVVVAPLTVAFDLLPSPGRMVPALRAGASPEHARGR
jgi:hypothetical protein